MKKPPRPANEAERLASLKNLCLLDTPAEERFDRITRLARRSLNTPIALVSLIDGERQWFKSAQGLSAPETSRDISFCGHAILGEGAFVVTDASADDRFADNPLVTGELAIRLYAGQPIRSPDGEHIGTLCVIDQQSREFGPEDRLLLADLAILVESELRVDALGQSEEKLRRQLSEAETRASVDALTRLWNRGTMTKLLEMELDRATRQEQHVAVAMIDIDCFKGINDTYGHAAGDEVLARTAERIRGGVRPFDSVGRYGGEEFLVVLSGVGDRESLKVGERVRRRVADTPIEFSGGTLNVTVSIGLCTSLAAQTSGKSIIEAADRALYVAKRNGRNRVEIGELQTAVRF